MTERVEKPSDVGMNGSFFAAAIGGCPCCRAVIDEPESDEAVNVVCPQCEFVLTWIPEWDEEDE